MSEKDKLLYGHEVARECGWSPAMMTASKAAGYRFQYGSKTTIRHYLKWRAANPDFRITDYVRAHSRPPDGHPVANARKNGSQSR